MTDAERATLTQRLSEAETQYHLLMSGQQARVFVDQNGERIEYAVANTSRLAAYIATLRSLLGLTTVTGPMRVWF